MSTVQSLACLCSLAGFGMGQLRTWCVVLLHRLHWVGSPLYSSRVGRPWICAHAGWASREFGSVPALGLKLERHGVKQTSV
nr:uncharacterized protein LOC112285205 isoform X4 [Physcomitrium patens]|eukprot:XP_024381632.1 uncharacterized protein LOC112285205 isoform X4 [Physcomitrella patens]